MPAKRRSFVLALVALVCGCQGQPGLPTTQMAIVQTGNGGPEVLNLEPVPVLDPGPGQVLIKIHAAAVNPVDWKMREGYRGGQAPVGTPPPDAPPARIPGYDAAGTVAKIGAGVVGLNVGDPVFTMIGRMEVDGLNGSYAQYALAFAERVMAKPEGLTFAEAAGMATVGLTAARILSPMNVQPGQRVFVNGVAGGVGSSVAQIAKASGAVVIGTASARHHEYLRSIGVDEIVDYTKVDFETVIDPVDVYVETVNAEIAARGLGILKPGGKIGSAVGFPPQELCEAASVDCPVPGPPGGPPPPGASGLTEVDLLERVRQLAAAGQYRVNVSKTFPLAEAAAAQEYNREGHTTGKVALIVDHDS